jgi:hypothetical protein
MFFNKPTKPSPRPVRPYQTNSFTDQFGLKCHQKNFSSIEERDKILILELIAVATTLLSYQSPNRCQHIQMLLDIERFGHFIRRLHEDLKAQVGKGQCFEVEVGITLAEKTVVRIKQIKEDRKSNLLVANVKIKRNKSFVEDTWCAHHLSKLFELKVRSSFPNRDIELACAVNKFEITSIMFLEHFMRRCAAARWYLGPGERSLVFFHIIIATPVWTKPVRY